MERPSVFAYYFPSWHTDARNEGWFGKGWSEWSLLKAARPRFEGHRQPRVPEFGYFDESEPQVFEKQIDLAKQYGVDGFIFDFYWYDDGPYLERALDEGFLGASNRADVQFALMWANHALPDIFPSPSPGGEETLLKHGAQDRVSFERMGKHVIENYFSQPNYRQIDGKPWFSIYEVGSLIEGLGGLNEAKDALHWFDEQAKAAGFAGVHFDGVVWGFDVLPGAVTTQSPEKIIASLGLESATSYVWIHHVDTSTLPFPTSPWEGVEKTAFEAYENYSTTLGVPFFPNVTVGWDASPRTSQVLPFVAASYPWIPVWDPTPAQFEGGLRRAAEFLEDHPYPHPMLTINAWNEWTEGSSLLPDTVNGLGFLEAIRTVFGTRDE